MTERIITQNHRWQCNKMSNIRTVRLSQWISAVVVLACLQTLILLVVDLRVARGQESEQVSVNFARDVRPLLSDRCFSCHGPDSENRQADLRVDQFESLVEVRDGGQVVKPGDSANSELIRRITSDDPEQRMPPAETGKPLSGEEIQTLVKWIDSGAGWQQHWAYEAPRQTPIPKSVSSNEPASLYADHWIDRYIARQLSEAGASFAAAADRITLARRLSFDLTGLPPTSEQLRSFANDSNDSAIDNYVNQLLASPNFGERMAIYWLDLVRFADTVGYHGDQDHNISLYRDYVIHAFNDNLSFQQFTLDQLAGDLLPNPSDEQIIATGYNRMLQTSHEGGVQAKEYLTIYAADRIRNLSAVWMGATVGCAQCHDHKFDPYTARDFYSLVAFFADVDEARHLKKGVDGIPTQREPEKNFLDRVQRLQLDNAQKQLELLQAADEDAEAQPSSTKQQCEQLKEQIASIEAAARKTMITVSIEPRPIRFLPRGNWMDDSGDFVSPNVPEFMRSTFKVQPDSQARPSRLDLAKWLIDDKDGIGLLTARVQVNRLWMLMFGYGLSRSVDDFGGQGEAPSHPELLDRLTLEFVRSGWDVKHMLRMLANTRTYQQSSLETNWHRTHDPLNRLLSRQNRYRISAEMVRDTALADSGLLVSQIGGASVKPYQPEGYYRHLNFPTRSYAHSTDEGQWRRGVYVHWQRQFLHPMFIAFDAPRREECTAQRPQSNTPLAALVWLNDPSLIEAARALAMRTLRQGDIDNARLRWMFEIVTSRLPDKREQELLQQLLIKARAEFVDQPERSQELLNVGLFKAESPVASDELAAWTNVARATLNLNEAYMRN